MKINIAIDGPSAAGKSTIAKALAKQLHLIHIDSGAMYRAVAYKALQQHIALDDAKGLEQLLKTTKIHFDQAGNIFVDDQDVSHLIRQDQISMAASTVSKMPIVRQYLVYQQQQMAKDLGYIMDGRDIGTVVLKDAAIKIFLSASSLARAKRRYDQNIQNHIETSSLEQIQQEIQKRDEQDANRAISPLKKADDAYEIDSSNLTIQQVIDEILGYMERKGVNVHA